MKKVAIFGKPGSGKSTLSKALANVTDLPLHYLDSIVYDNQGQMVDRESYDLAHNQLLAADQWIIDGFGPIGSFYQRLGAADTLIYIDLPYWVCYWLVTKRLLKGLFVTPAGWPKGSSIIKGSVQSYKMLKLSPKFWNDEFLQNLEKRSEEQTIYVIRSISELKQLASTVGSQA